MPDTEKVINGLDCCLDVIRSRQFSSGCGFCPYVGEEHCKVKMIEEAIALLKEREIENSRIANEYLNLKKVVSKQRKIVRCKDCKYWDSEEHICNIKVVRFACGAD